MADKGKKSRAERLVDVRAMTPDQLQDELVALKREQFSLRFQAATGQLEGTARMAAVRREIAVVKTVMREKAIAAVSPAQAG